MFTAVTVIEIRIRAFLSTISPQNHTQSKAWRIRIRREDFQPTKHSYVCSRHFVSEDSAQQSKDTPAIFQKKRLKRGAIPSLFLRGEDEDQRKQRSTRTSTRTLESPDLHGKEETNDVNDGASASWMEMDETIDETLVPKAGDSSTGTSKKNWNKPSSKSRISS